MSIVDTCSFCGKYAEGETVLHDLHTGQPLAHVCNSCLKIAGNYPYLDYFDQDILKAASKETEISSLVWTRANCDRLERLGYLACIDREAPKWMEHLICKYEITEAGRERVVQDSKAGRKP